MVLLVLVRSEQYYLLLAHLKLHFLILVLNFVEFLWECIRHSRITLRKLEEFISLIPEFEYYPSARINFPDFPTLSDPPTIPRPFHSE